MSPKKKKRRAPVGLLLVAAVAAGGWFLATGDLLGGDDESVVLGAPVRRGPLRISVLQRGNLEAKNSAVIKSEVEGRNAILELVPEGTWVEEGDLLVTLDDSSLRDKRDSQQIGVHNTEADYTKARQQYEIQESQNASDVAAAEQRVEFARTDLDKYVEGDWPRQFQEAEEAIVLAKEEEASAKDRLEWSRNLNERGFLTRTELERDELSYQRSVILLEQAKRKKELLQKFDHPKQLAVLQADLREAERELERVMLQARARLVDFEAAMRTSKARYELETEKLAKLERQLQKTRMHAPRSGMVVYSRDGGGRWGDDEPMAEGKEVREGEEILTIPREGGMVAEASVHETVLKQVKPGQPCSIKIDAIPERTFRGTVDSVALLPDKQSWWANPDQRLYKTEVSMLDSSGEVRPGMSCSIEILIAELDDALHVPVQAVFLDGARTVAFVPGGGDVEERDVEVGLSNEQWVEVRSGLAEGETVLLAPPSDWTPEPAPEPEGDEGAPPYAAEAGAGSDGQRAGAGGGRPAAGRGGEWSGDPGRSRSKDGAGAKAAVAAEPAAAKAAAEPGADAAEPAVPGSSEGTPTGSETR